jgi:membrane protease subunit HflC
MNYRTPAGLLAIILALALLSQSLFVVPQGNLGVVRRLQSTVAQGLTPGPHLKLPFLDEVSLLDAGGIVLDSDLVNGGHLKFTAEDGTTLDTGYFAVWRITDPAVFCSADGCDEEAAARRLNQLVTAALRDGIAAAKFGTVMAKQARFTAGMAESLNPEAARLGAHFDRIDLTGVTLPPAGLEDVYTRMRSAEEAKAAELRGEGSAQAARSRAATDAERDRILATGDAESARTRATGEAAAAAVYARASREEPEFFSFWHNLAAYRRSLAGQTVWVLDSDSPFLKYLKPPRK